MRNLSVFVIPFIKENVRKAYFHSHPKIQKLKVIDHRCTTSLLLLLPSIFLKEIKPEKCKVLSVLFNFGIS